MLPQLSGSAAPSTQKAPHGMHAGPPLPRHRPRACPVRLRHVTPKPPCAHGCRDVRPDQPALTSRLVVPASSCAGKVGGGRGGPPLACPACYAGLISCQTNALRCPVVFPRPGGHYPGHHPPPGATCPAPPARVLAARAPRTVETGVQRTQLVQRHIERVPSSRPRDSAAGS